MDEELLQALEEAYNKGITFEQLQGRLTDEALVVAEDFFSKKKASTEDSQIASPSVSVSEPSVRSTGSLSTQLESESKAVNQGLFGALQKAKNNGVSLDQLQGKLTPDAFKIAKQYYNIGSQSPPVRAMKDHWLIIDDNPSEIGRLWNRAVAGGILANEISMAEQSGLGMDYEKIAYLNSIVERDAVRDSDYLYDESGSAVDDFALDILRIIPESLISMATAIKPGLEGAGVGAGAGAAAGLAGGPLAGVTSTAGAITGATAGYFGATSLALEYSGSIMDVLREEGINVTDPQALADAVQDEEIMKKARAKGLKRGIPIGIFDAISGGVAGKVGKTVVKSVYKSARNQAAKVLAAETLVQAGLGGGGELAGQLIAGEELRPRDIALEAFAEIGPAAPVMAYKLTGRIGKTPGEIGYLDWAETQNQKDLKDANEIAFLVNNGEITSIDNEIAQLRESQKKDPTVKKAVEGKIRRLRNQKYDLLRQASEQVINLEGEKRIQAAELAKEIYTAAEVLKKADNLSAQEQQAIEEEMEANSKALDDLLLDKPKQVRDDEEEVTGQAASEVEPVPESQTSRAKAQINDILKARAEDSGRSSRHMSANQARQKFEGNKKGFFNLFDKNDAAALRQMLEEGKWSDGTRISPLEQRTITKLILASEAMLRLEPDATHFNIGFGRKGYRKAGRNAGFSAKGIKTSAAITSGFIREKTRTPNRVAVEIPLRESSLEGRGTQDRYTPQGAAYHEVYHNIFRRFFNGNPIDFNQFRKLIIRRLSESNVKELNDFTKRYEERETPNKAGAYRSEEFMVELGGLLADERIAFEPSFLEEVQAFLNAVVGKLTGQRVQIFEEAALAKDIAAYMTGLAKAVRAGGDLSQVTMSERLQTERFQRKRPEVKEKKEVDEYGFEKPTGEMEVTPSENLAGEKDPKNYDKTLDPLEQILGFIKPRMEGFLKKLEKTLGVDRLRARRRDVLQALEVSESINVQHINRFFLALRQVNRITNKLSEADRERAANLANDYLFGENNETREAALKELMKMSPDLASQLGRLRAVRASMQESIQNSSVFAKLSTELQEVIIENTAKYGTRTYRAFTDPNFKFDPKLRRAAYKAMVEGKIIERAYDIEENMTEEIAEEMRKNQLDPTEMDDIFRYVEFNEKEINAIRKSVSNALRALEEAAENQKGTYGEGLSGSRELGKMRIPTKKLRERRDLPIELMDYLGVEKDPYIKFSQTIATLTNMVQQFTLTDRVNEIAQQSNLGDLIITKSVIKRLENNLLSFSQLVDLARDTGLIQKGESLVDFYKRVGLDELIDKDGNRTRDQIAERDAVYETLYNYFKKNYTVITESKSPMNGKAVKNDFVSMLKQTPLYQSDSKDPATRKFVQGYYKLLLQMRRVRVLYNLPTWRKNIMGGWYFLGANFVLPYNKHRGGLTVMKDLRNRFKKMKDGVTDPEIEKVLNRMGELGLLGSSPNMGMFTDINQSFIDQLNGISPDVAWKWLPERVKQAQRKMGTRAARIAYQYGFIDDYTKMIAYLTKRENFAKRLATNPDGKSYSELSVSEQQQVDEAVAERIKQNMPTMSRIHPAFRNLFKTPFGDFLSFRVEAFRSFFGIYKNAVADISEAMTNQNLTKSQRSAYMIDGVGSLSMGIILAGASTMGYQAIANMLLEDDEEEELAQQARGTNYILPPWMQGANIVAVDMNEQGKIRFANISSEDPYDEIQGLIYGREGISRSKTLTNIASDFSDPNLAARLLFNLADGKDSYGRPILNNQDVGWFHRYIIGPSLTEWSDAYGSYIFKETFLPPNMNYIAREYRKRMKEAEKNPDIELQPLETAAQLSTAVLFRDYPVDIAKQFYYNMAEQNFRKPYAELTESQKVNRQVRLDEVKRAYEFAVNYSMKFGNYKIMQSVESTINRTFSKSPEEKLYVLYDVELPN